jgi:hypothetical protein
MMSPEECKTVAENLRVMGPKAVETEVLVGILALVISNARQYPDKSFYEIIKECWQGWETGEGQPLLPTWKE